MKSIKGVIAVFTLMTIACLSAPEARSWGRLGHATVAKIAYDHLTPKARKAILEYVGAPLPAISSDADTYRPYWTMDLGFVPSNPEYARKFLNKELQKSLPLNISPWSHSITVDDNFKSFPNDNLNGEYINNDAYYVSILSKELRENAKNMDPFERYKAIALIVHFLGDMHCPMHVVYYPKNTLKGANNVIFKGKQMRLHDFWDGAVFQTYYPTGFGDMAFLADTATPKEIKEITEGDVFDWAGRTAEKCWPLHNRWKEGDTLPDLYPLELRPVLLGQLRDAGYRLAKLLNETFK